MRFTASLAKTVTVSEPPYKWRVDGAGRAPSSSSGGWTGGRDGKCRRTLATLAAQNQRNVSDDLDIIRAAERTHDWGSHAV